MPSSNRWPRFCAWLKRYANVGVAFGTLCLASVAYWQGTLAYKEMEQMRFAANLPMLDIRNTPPSLDLTVTNVGKGPATLLSIRFSDEPCHSFPVDHESKNKEFLLPTIPTSFTGENFNELAKKYGQKRGWKDIDKFDDLVQKFPCKFGGQREYYIQYADAFKNQYRQYFYYDGTRKKVVSPGRFEVVPSDSKEYIQWDPRPRPPQKNSTNPVGAGHTWAAKPSPSAGRWKAKLSCLHPTPKSRTVEMAVRILSL